MSWKKAGSDRGKFLRFEAGKSYEGTYSGFEERTNPFYDNTKPESPEMITDYKIEVDNEDKILSSTAKTLRDQLKPLVAPIKVKVDMIQKGIKKFYQVWTTEE
jgi:hypothetical protein